MNGYIKNFATVAAATAGLSALEEGQLFTISGTNQLCKKIGNTYTTLVDSDRDTTVTSGSNKLITSNAVSVSESYSTTETKTGGTFIDGKPIYRKVGESSNQSDMYSDAGWYEIAREQNVQTVISLKIIQIGDSDPQWLFHNIMVRKNNDQISIIPTGQGISAPKSGHKRYYIIEYTKTTN